VATLVTVVGNPKAQSRTRTAAVAIAERTAEAVGLTVTARTVWDLAELGAQLFDWSSPDVRAAVDSVTAADLLVVASPTYKASYTGLLKSFLDWFGTTGLAGVAAVPVMVGAGAAHALAVEVHLRPVLVEIGATLPTRGLFVLEEQLGQLDSVIDAWLVDAAAPLRAALTAPRPGARA
jgi:FMN reductase